MKILVIDDDPDVVEAFLVHEPVLRSLHMEFAEEIAH